MKRLLFILVALAMLLSGSPASLAFKKLYAAPSGCASAHKISEAVFISEEHSFLGLGTDRRVHRPDKLGLVRRGYWRLVGQCFHHNTGDKIIPAHES